MPGIDLSKAPAELFTDQDNWLIEADTVGTSREAPPLVTTRGPGSVILNTASYRLAGAAARALGLAEAPNPTWFQVGIVLVDNTYLVVIQPVAPDSPGAVAGAASAGKPMVINGLHNFFRRKGIHLTSREGRRCSDVNLQAVPGRGPCLVVNYTDGQPFVYGPAGEEPAAAEAAATGEPQG